MDVASTEDGQVSHLEFTSDEDYAAHLFGRLEKKEADRSGETRKSVRKSLAQRIGIAPGTAENLLRGRIKAIKTHVYKSILAAADRELRAEILRLERERTYVAAKAGSVAEVQVRKVDAHIEAARAALSTEG